MANLTGFLTNSYFCTMPKAKKASQKSKTKPVAKPKGEQDRITHISRIVFEGYKSIDHLEIDLVKGLNILIGPNGSGKSNFLELLNLIFNNYIIRRRGFFYVDAEIEIETNHKHKFKWYTERGSDTIPITKTQQPNNSKIGDIYNTYTKEIIYKDSEKVFNSDEIKNPAYDIDRIIGAMSGVLFQSRLLDDMPTLLINYSLPNSLGVLETPGKIEIEKRSRTIRPDSASFLSINRLIQDYSSLLSHWIFLENSIKDNVVEKIKKPLISELLKDNLKKITPIKGLRFKDSINVYEDENRMTIDNLALEFLVEAEWIPWSYLSDGTKRLFYIISEISYYKGPIVLIEEPELGIHPHQFHELMKFLKQEAKSRQIIMSTHSPEALNVLDENELGNIVVTKYSKEKGTTMAHLSKQQISKAKAYMSDEYLFLSDYWIMSDLEG